MFKKKERIFVPNEQSIENAEDLKGVPYNPQDKQSRREMARAIYSLLKTSKGMSFSILPSSSFGDELVYTKTFGNGMKLEIMSSVLAITEPGDRYPHYEMTPYGQGRIYYRLSYTIPQAYANKAGVSANSYTFESRPVNRRGTIAQIIARINSGVVALEKFADYVYNAPAYFAKVARGETTIEEVETSMNGKSQNQMKLVKTNITENYQTKKGNNIMKVSERQIKQIIKEEYSRIVREGWDGLSPEEQEEIMASRENSEMTSVEDKHGFGADYDDVLDEEMWQDHLEREYEEQEDGRYEREEAMYRKDPSMQFENRIRRMMRQRRMR